MFCGQPNLKNHESKNVTLLHGDEIMTHFFGDLSFKLALNCVVTANSEQQGVCSDYDVSDSGPVSALCQDTKLISCSGVELTGGQRY